MYSYGNWTSIGRPALEVFLEEFSLLTRPALQGFKACLEMNFEVQEILFDFEGIQQYENYLMTQKKSEYEKCFQRQRIKHETYHFSARTLPHHDLVERHTKPQELQQDQLQ